jgi:drug/metabolite transporter (DMT)-like permease
VFLRYFTDPEYHLDLWMVNAVRYTTAAVFWFPFVLVLGRRFKALDPPPVQRSVWVAAALPALVNLAGQVGWAAAPYFIDAPTIGFVIRTSFLFTIVLGFLFVPPERVLAGMPLFYLGAAACLAGTAVMFVGRLGGEQSLSPKRLAGLAIIIWTALCWGGYAVSVRRLLTGYPFRLAFGVVSLYTAAAVVVLMLVFGDYPRLAGLPLKVWALLVVSGFIGIALGHVLLYRSIHGIGPLITSGVQMAAPFVTCSAAAVFLVDEALTGPQLVGGIVVVVGGLLLVKARAEVGEPRVPPVVD